MLYSIGVPVGVIDNSTDGYFFANDRLLRMRGVAFRIWGQFMQGNEADKAIRAVRKHTAMNVDEIEQIIQQLQTVELLADEDALFQHKPQRFGRGLGRIPDSEKCTVFLNTAVEVNYGSYLIWCYCDGKVSLQETISKLNAEFDVQLRKEQVLPCIHELLQKNLLAFVE